MLALWQAALAAAIMLMLPARADEPATFVGAQSCAACHRVQFEAWKGSHHALAMQDATEKTVLADFADAKLEHSGVATSFFRNGEKFMVGTDGPDGTLHDYPIDYTFGVYPLEQYLVAFPGGRYQTLGIAWDSRPKDQGGQRWFHLYPGQQLKPGDPLHWTGRDQTWNYQCANCHSTDLQKNYDLAANSYATSWSDLDVACEACHGPGSRHAAWGKTHVAGGPYPPGSDTERLGLTNWLKPTDNGHWEINPETGIARRPLPTPGTPALAGGLPGLPRKRGREGWGLPPRSKPAPPATRAAR
jgi:hypothetical protein